MVNTHGISTLFSCVLIVGYYFNTFIIIKRQVGI